MFWGQSAAQHRFGTHILRNNTSMQDLRCWLSALPLLSAERWPRAAHTNCCPLMFSRASAWKGSWLQWWFRSNSPLTSKRFSSLNPLHLAAAKGIWTGGSFVSQRMKKESWWDSTDSLHKLTPHEQMKVCTDCSPFHFTSKPRRQTWEYSMVNLPWHGCQSPDLEVSSCCLGCSGTWQRSFRSSVLEDSKFPEQPPSL